MGEPTLLKVEDGKVPAGIGSALKNLIFLSLSSSTDTDTLQDKNPSLCQHRKYGCTGNRKKGALPVDGYALKSELTTHLGHGAVHFAYVVKSHMKNAAKSITRAIFSYTAFTPFQVGIEKFHLLPWRNGGQITTYRWYRQRAEKSYFFLSFRISADTDTLQRKFLSLSAQKDGLTTFTIYGYTGNRKRARCR